MSPTSNTLVEVPKALWLDRCTMRIGDLRPGLSPQGAVEVARELWEETGGQTDPEAAAEAEVDSWPPWQH